MPALSRAPGPELASLFTGNATPDARARPRVRAFQDASAGAPRELTSHRLSVSCFSFGASENRGNVSSVELQSRAVVYTWPSFCVDSFSAKLAPRNPSHSF